MNVTLKRAGLGIAAVLVAAGVYAGTQDQNTNRSASPFKQGRFGGPGGRGGAMGFLPRFGRDLNLTEAQRTQIRALADSRRDEWQALAGRSRTAHEALRAAVTADTVNESVIREKSAEVASVEADMAVARARAHAEFLQLLTADQRAKLKERQAQASARRPSPRGRH